MLACTSCDTSQKERIQEDAPELLSVEDFAYLGEWHNAFLFNAQAKVEYLDDLEPTQLEAIDYLLDINLSYAKQTMPQHIAYEDIAPEFERFRLFANETYLAERCFLAEHLRSQEWENAGPSLFEMIDELKSHQVISPFAEQLLLQLTNDLRDNYNKLLSDAELKASILDLIDQFNRHGFEQNSREGDLVGTILAISIASLECWESNPSLFPSDAKIAHWVAMDISGAAVGAVSGAVVNYIRKKEFSAGAIACSAVAGAVVGSTGIVGKGAKWIQSLFK